VKIFDRKLDFACLSRIPGFSYLMAGHLHDNWIRPPPGMSARQWVPSYYEIEGPILDVRVATRSLMARVTFDLIKEFDSEQTGVWPTQRDVYERLKRLKFPAVSHLARYTETAINRFEGKFAVFGDAINSHRRLNWQVFADTSWAVCLHGIPTDLQSLYISVVVARLLLHRIANNLRSSALNTLIVLDEASTVFRKQYEMREGTYLLSDYLCQAREFGVGFLIGSQSFSQLAPSVIANTATKVMIGGFGSGDDYAAFAASTGMTVEQREFTKRGRRPGHAIVRDPRWPATFQVEVPRVA
jgi:hypothetical protein